MGEDCWAAADSPWMLQAGTFHVADASVRTRELMLFSICCSGGALSASSAWMTRDVGTASASSAVN